jgi:ankyrin repeat protein
MGVDINAQNRNGNTALHYAYAYKFSQLSEILIQYGADSVITNNEGLVPSQGLGQIEEQEAASKSNMPLS